MIFSPTCQHALRALIYLAHQDQHVPVLVRDIAESESIPRPFLSKILHDLRKKRLVESVKGPGGGYFLARSPDDIHITEIVEAVDGSVDMTDSCILGLDECNDDSPCALHDYWKTFRKHYADTIAGMSLQDATRILEKKRRNMRSRKTKVKRR